MIAKLLSRRCFSIGKARALYLDYQATTQIDYRVLDSMLPYMTQMFGNPHSRTQYGGFSDEASSDGKPRKQLIRQGRKLRSSSAAIARR